MRTFHILFTIALVESNFLSAMIISPNPSSISDNASIDESKVTTLNQDLNLDEKTIIIQNTESTAVKNEKVTVQPPINNSNVTVFSYVTREGWGARTSKLKEYFKEPAAYVIIHHSYKPEACNTTAECISAMQKMQNFHMDDRGWNDIGYTFAVGGDGLVYQGRGFQVIGAHAPGYNARSVGICTIGDWRHVIPSQNMLDSIHALIDFGIQNGNIAPDYKLLGHRQVRQTDCPGDALFNTIKQWPHWTDLMPLNKPQINTNTIPT